METARRMDAREVMGRFMGRLNEEGFAKENRPNNGPEMTQEFVAERIISYTKLLDSQIFKNR